MWLEIMILEPRTHLAMMLWAPAWGVLRPVHAADDTSEWTPVTESVRRKSVKLKGLRDSTAAEKRLPRSNGAIGQTHAAPDVPSAAPVLVKFRPIVQDRKMAPMIRGIEITLPLAPRLESSLRCFSRHVQDGGPGGHPLRFALASGRAGLARLIETHPSHALSNPAMRSVEAMRTETRKQRTIRLCKRS